MIQMYNVTKYPEGIALRDVSFQVGKGEFCYITGHLVQKDNDAQIAIWSD